MMATFTLDMTPIVAMLLEARLLKRETAPPPTLPEPADPAADEAAATLLAEVTRLNERLTGSAAMIDRLQADLHALESSNRRGETPRPLPPRFSPAARRVLARNPLFLDYETTGIRKKPYHVYAARFSAIPPHRSKDRKLAQVVEVAIVDRAGAVVFTSLIRPPVPIPAEATAVHGIADADVAHAPTWDELAPTLRAIMSGRTVVAHNARFEQAFTPDDWGIDWVCTKEMADEFFGKADYWDVQAHPELGSSLSARLARLGLTPPTAAHTAVADCLSALQLLKGMAGE